MKIPLEITFHGLSASDALRKAISERVDRLSRQVPNALSCHVTVEHETHRHHQGNIYRVHARLVMPGGEINAGESPTPDKTHEDVYVAVRDTFDALRRRLEDHIRRERGDVKHHEMPISSSSEEPFEE